MYYKKLQNSKNGFTLIELLVVISIIGLLSSVVLASLQSARDKGVTGAAIQFEDHTYHAFGASAVAIWGFDEGSGTTISDISGNNNNLTLITSTDWATAAQAFRGNSALSLPGSGSIHKATISNLKNFSTSNGSISFWIKPFDTNQFKYIFSDSTNHFIVMLNIEGTLTGSFINLYLGDGVQNRQASGQKISQYVNKWTHVVVTWSGSSFDMYFNGVKQVLTNSTYSAPTVSTSFTVGNDGGGASALSGYLDEMRVYTQSLQTAQVQQLYAEGLKTHSLANSK
ncbi:MAG: prepilin-type N-terminal cleavage/methylation domain-containing protein [Candidatus Pacebacteria bacterium]|nr:prepilin-type N-terminal cleavage/methylation domain-containing protein [Candidatus Paceibacterota bacterium]